MLKFDVAGGDVQEASARAVDVERIGAAQVDSQRRGRLDEEQARGRPDADVDGAGLQRQPVVFRTGFHQLQTRVGLDLDVADDSDVEGRAGLVVRFEPFAPVQLARVGELCFSDARRAIEPRNLPRRERSDNRP